MGGKSWLAYLLGNKQGVSSGLKENNPIIRYINVFSFMFNDEWRTEACDHTVTPMAELLLSDTIEVECISGFNVAQN
jgi:hypothetical protein